MDGLQSLACSGSTVVANFDGGCTLNLSIEGQVWIDNRGYSVPSGSLVIARGGKVYVNGTLTEPDPSLGSRCASIVSVMECACALLFCCFCR